MTKICSTKQLTGEHIATYQREVDKKGNDIRVRVVCEECGKPLSGWSKA